MIRAIYVTFGLFLLSPFEVKADCYQWPIREKIAYDGDTLYILLSGLPETIQNVSVRVRGVDTPEIRSKCEFEKQLAFEAKSLLISRVQQAKDVLFCHPEWGKYGGRVLADVYIDGENVADLMIANSLGRPYFGGKRAGWCS
ncbi:thermonuclease family protein [Aestuariispira insulae]|uniref:Nuclease-like protein n=1 Tax=Aestuariispira insulae TaxID=1461337 RepID=A0A3D9H3M2_9PROT|nr:thermonuclease family protein [Aestuariispira insulae]RED44103.1 nuclease-like protein [Aestuariispira insulae]